MEAMGTRAGDTVASSAGAMGLMFPGGNVALPIQGGGGGGGGGYILGEGDSDGPWSESDIVVVGTEERATHDSNGFPPGKFHTWGAPEEEVTEDMKDRIWTGNGFRFSVTGHFDRSQMAHMFEWFKPFAATCGQDAEEPLKTQAILRFATRKQLKAAIKYLPGLAAMENLHIEVARIGTSGKIKSGGMWSEGPPANKLSPEGVTWNMVFADRFPELHYTQDLVKLNKTLIGMMEGAGNLVDGSLACNRGRFKGWAWYEFSDAGGAKLAVRQINGVEVLGSKIRVQIFERL